MLFQYCLSRTAAKNDFKMIFETKKLPVRADFCFDRYYSPETSAEEFVPSPVPAGALHAVAAVRYCDQAALRAADQVCRALFTALLKLDQAVFVALLTAAKVVCVYAWFRAVALAPYAVFKDAV